MQRPDFPPIYKVLNSALFGGFSTPHPPLREGSLFGGRQRFWPPPPRVLPRVGPNPTRIHCVAAPHPTQACSYRMARQYTWMKLASSTLRCPTPRRANEIIYQVISCVLC